MRLTTRRCGSHSGESASVAETAAAKTATITLNRPERLNAIDASMPGETANAVQAANDDKRVHVITVTGAPGVSRQTAAWRRPR